MCKVDHIACSLASDQRPWSDAKSREISQNVHGCEYPLAERGEDRATARQLEGKGRGRPERAGILDRGNFKGVGSQGVLSHRTGDHDVKIG